MRLLASTKRRLKRALIPVVGKVALKPALRPEAWDLEVRPQGLFWDGVDLAALRARWGSPLHVVHRGRLERNARAFLSVPAGSAQGCEVFYSYKTHPVPGVLQRLHGLGVGAEVISAYELWLALELGVAPDRIVYNGPVKSEESLGEAMRRGLGLIVANHREELAKLVRVASAVGKRPRIAVRVNTSSSWTAQFGTPIAGGDALAACEEVRANPSLELVGVQAHRGGMIHSEDELLAFVGELLAFTDTLAERGIELEVLDFGGSLGSPTVRHLSAAEWRLGQTFLREPAPPAPERALRIERYVQLLVEAVEQHFGRRGRKRPRIFLEPGRAMTSDAQLLLGTVQSTKAAGERTYLILDAGINLAESARSEFHQLLAVSHAGEAAQTTYTVVGPICSPGDTLYPATRLPLLEAGDAVAIMDAGAYFVPFATSFSFPQPAIVEVDGGQARPLRRAERFEDRVALDEGLSPRGRTP